MADTAPSLVVVMGGGVVKGCGELMLVRVRSGWEWDGSSRERRHRSMEIVFIADWTAGKGRKWEKSEVGEATDD